ncbi:MAG: phytanoyl-CoA dioxygenase family protein [Planctomycetes bacterium]|nr:phytanoyl-CoA dioxygenase family protein [Planctomycetota bacterium]
MTDNKQAPQQTAQQTPQLTQELSPLRISNDAINDGDELRRRLAEDGYLFLRRIHDLDMMRDLRKDILSVLKRHGWLSADSADSELMDGIANIGARCTEGSLDYAIAYHEIYSLESFHRSAHWPEIMNLLNTIIAKPFMPHPQKVLRMWFPQYTEHTTPIHQDYVHFQGCFDTYTCWSPVGDCPMELGGLAVLRGSHKVERVLEHHFSLGAGSMDLHEDQLEGEWHSIDYEAGDVLIFNALMAHKALPNVTEDRLRLSLDNRYVALDRPIAEHMLQPHLDSYDDFTWEDAYKNWGDSDLRYYWKQNDLKVVPLETQFSDAIYNEALDLAIGGNEHARYWIQRRAESFPNEPESERAREAGLLQGQV